MLRVETPHALQMGLPKTIYIGVEIHRSK